MDARPNSLAARDIAHLVHPQTNLKLHQEVGPVVFERGSGVWISDEDGNRLLDAMSGLWCAALGYTPERLARAAYEQMQKMAYGHLYRHRSHEPAVALAESLLSIAPPSMTKVHFQNSGSEANDVAVKLVWYYHNAIGKPEKRKIISRKGAYHGSSVATASLSGKADMHAGFNLPLEGFLHTDEPYYYRDAEDGESEEDYANRLAGNLELMIEQEGPDTVGAFFAEPVLGSSGAIPPPRTYFDKVQKVLKKYDVLFVVDEVITGFGRTGDWWASETFALEPDMISCAKALSAGALPISALMMNDRIHEAMISQSAALGNYAHGHTYAGHPVSAAVALETLAIYGEMDIPGHTARLGRRLEQMIVPLAEHPMVGGIDVTGFMAGIEIAAGKSTGTPSPADKKVTGRIEEAARQEGLIVKSIGSRICLAPAFIITEDEIGEIAGRLKRALDLVYAEVGAA